MFAKRMKHHNSEPVKKMITVKSKLHLSLNLHSLFTDNFQKHAFGAASHMVLCEADIKPPSKSLRYSTRYRLSSSFP